MRLDVLSKIQLITSPWYAEFNEFVTHVKRSMLIVSPFITRMPLEVIADTARNKSLDSIVVITSLSPDGLVNGSNDTAALADFCEAVRLDHIVNIPTLHAKVYSADQSNAILTSANLTTNGLTHNMEFGVWIRDPQLVVELDDTLTHYGSLGFHVSKSQLHELSSLTSRLKSSQARQNAIPRVEFDVILNQTRDSVDEHLRISRAIHGESTNSIFSRTIVFGLRQGPRSTPELHEFIRSTHPDLCDDRIDRVINGVNFGKRWKHMVRNAQQSLSRKGIIARRNQQWHLVRNEIA